MEKLKTGDRVRFINAERHIRFPGYYPPAGTIGKVVRIVVPGYLAEVEWPLGSILSTGTKNARFVDLKKIEGGN